MNQEKGDVSHINQTHDNSVNVIFFKYSNILKFRNEFENRKLDRSSQSCAPIKPHELARQCNINVRAL